MFQHPAPAEFVASLAAAIEAAPGYHYSRQMLADRVAAGLQIGDTATARGITTRYMGDRVEILRKDGSVERSVAASSRALELMLGTAATAAACAAAPIKTGNI